MHGQAATPAGAGSSPPPSLSQRGFPRRVRMLLEGILEFASDALDRGIAITLNEQEQFLFKMAEQARSNEAQARCFEALREIKRGRADLLPRMLVSVEASLASLREPRQRGASFGIPQASKASELSLVDDVELDETGVLNEIAGRTEIRNSLPLFLLGQRFGVIAGRPAFDAETLPVGPHAICRALRDAVVTLDLNLENRLSLYRQFERQFMLHTGPFYESLNGFLIREQVLPHLTFVPVRARPTAQDPATERSRREAARDAVRAAHERGDAELLQARPDQRARGEQRSRHEDRDPRRARDRGGEAEARSHAPRPYTGWPGMPADPRQGGQDQEMFDVLRELLSGRRALLGKLGSSRRPQGPQVAASEADVQAVLGVLQNRPAPPLVVDGRTVPRSVHHVKQDLLAQLRQLAPDRTPPTLDEADADTIDLVGMLFDHIMKDVRPNTPAANLLTRLQVPLMRVALRDKSFFTRRQHPARQMLNAVAETGAYWMGDDDADRTLVHKMQMLVDRVTSEFDGDVTLFEALLDDLSDHLQTQVRKAEVAERRHIEAARGKEKLEVSRLKAAETVDRLLAGKRVPKFLNALLGQAWTDVLALTLLRHGEDSDGYRHQVRVAERLIEAAVTRRTTGETLIGPTEVQTLRGDIEQALLQVGYHAEDAQSVAARLAAASQEEEELDPASRTELTMALKSRARLGETVAQQAPDGKRLAPLTDEERASLERICALPFGTWFEFIVNQQGDRARRRLSWFSTTTGHCLFVNHRGQRVGEYSLQWLARELHRGNVSVVEVTQGNVIDRAWQSIVSALRSFSGGGAAAGKDPA